MKARLIANCVLQTLASLMTVIIYILLFSFVMPELWHESFSESTLASSQLISFALIAFLSFFVNIASVVMGIVTLAMDKDDRVKGLTIASGILGIFSGAFFAGTIVSLIAISKINKADHQVDDHEPQMHNQ